MVSPERRLRIGGTPDTYPDSSLDPQMATIDPDLIEREAELRALDQALAGAIAGRGSVVAIEGEGGTLVPGSGRPSSSGAIRTASSARPRTR